MATGKHPLSTLSPRSLAQAYQSYLVQAADQLADIAGEDLSALLKRKVNRSTEDLVVVSDAIHGELGLRNTPKKVAGWLAEGPEGERHRELLETLLDRLDQEMPALEKAHARGKLPELQLAKDGKLSEDNLAPFIHHLSFSLETLQDATDLLRRGGPAVAADVEERVESVPEILPPEGGPRPGDFDDADDIDDPAFSNGALMALAKELLGDQEAPEKKAPAPAPVSPFVASLIGMVSSFVQAGSLEVTEEGAAAVLGERLADAIDQLSRQHNPAEAIVNWFVDQDEVEEVYFDGEELRKKLSELQ